LNPAYVFFYDKKKNMIIDGVFSKLMFSNKHVSCIGIALETPFQIQAVRLLQPSNYKPDAVTNKARFTMEHLDTSVAQCETKYDGGNYVNTPRHKSVASADFGYKWDVQLAPCEWNVELVTALSQYEDAILTQYKLMSGLKHTIVHSLGTQLNYDHIVIHTHSNVFPENAQITLKISGVWETSTHIGITYKFGG
jgi:hypothetical protein